MAVVAVLVKLDSPGPAFFRQQRVGKSGKLFNIVKFRTMVINAEELGPQVTSSDDKRMTRLGRVLRATKIDELPQLFNVFRGEMSLVGPRPQVKRYVDQFEDGMRSVILSVPPGITGPTAIVFRHEEMILEGREDRETFYIDTLLPVKCKLDCEYVFRQSFGTDTKVMVDTLKVFVSGVGHRLLLRPMGKRIEVPMPNGLIELLAGEELGDKCVVANPLRLATEEEEPQRTRMML
jgi:lipopolysaccharide/colanic/teichoic acid biosynthesis glycosyltransferase